ncbi:MAG: cobalamin biosynthesis protein [Synechococcales cyanobacterium RU_4_20]|nr:cobalamin biosynthesis protein [Synechococcales cyanobacterium RU_4_20]
MSLIAVLLTAAALDFLLADPWSWPHPVQVMGWLIERYKRWVFDAIAAPRLQKVAGVGLGLLLILGSGLIGAMIVITALSIHPGLGLGIAVILLASCFAGRSLRRAAEDVLGPLSSGDLVQARDRLSRYVGRDTATLSPEEIYRAIFESVTENAIDGVLAPLFYAGFGAGLGAGFSMGFSVGFDTELSMRLGTELGTALASQASLSGAIAGALAYKAASTLDSMVGYRDMPYTHLGWFSARLEDGLTWLPCRLAVLCIALLSGQPRRVLRLCWRDARQDPSPNSGWSECVYAAALGVQVGGDNHYRGQIKSKPLLGDDRQPITPERIGRALELTRLCFLGWLGLMVMGIALCLSQAAE